MNEAEKERLIKKDLVSIENRVRHAFNQGYEMGMKESRSEIPNTCGDAISRQAVMDCFKKWQPYMATRLWDFEQELSALPSVSPQHSDAEIQKIQEMEQAEIQKAYELGKAEMQPCDDAISRQAAISAIEALQLPIMREASTCYQFKFSGMSEAKEAVENLPSVTPQQRTGRWIPVWERAPEKKGTYLVTQKATFTDYVYISVIGYALNLYDVDEYDFADKKRPGWYEYDSEWGYRELDDVIAWMPLVEPYKEVQE